MAKKNKSQKPVRRKVDYPVGDFLIRLKNASLAQKKTVTLGNTKLVKAVSESLKKAGFLDNVRVENGLITVYLSYQKKMPRLLNIKIVSKPGRRVYKSADDLSSIKSPSAYIITTSKGVMTAKEAVKNRLGGEVIAEVL